MNFERKALNSNCSITLLRFIIDSKSVRRNQESHYVDLSCCLWISGRQLLAPSSSWLSLHSRPKSSFQTHSFRLTLNWDDGNIFPSIIAAAVSLTGARESELSESRLDIHTCSFGPWGSPGSESHCLWPPHSCTSYHPYHGCCPPSESHSFLLCLSLKNTSYAQLKSFWSI